MDGSIPDSMYIEERRRRLAAERTLEHARRELQRAHSALVANADRLSRSYLSEREQNLRLTERQAAVLAQRKEAAERADRSRRRLWHALETMRDGFALFDAKGILVAANHVYLDLFDAGSAIAPGAHASDLFVLAADEGAFDIGEESPEDWAAALVARWDQEVIAPMVLRHCDGRVLRVQDRRAPDGDVVSLAIDVTEDRDREASLAMARDEAERMARAKAEFLARMSHEIRTPMNGVLGMSRMLVDRAEDAETALYARTIRDSAEALLVIVNDTLDVSRLEAGRIDLRCEAFDLEALLCDCLRLVAVTARPGVDCAMSYPLAAATRFVGDAGRIRQVVTNLLGNAVKFTETGRVVLRAEIDAEDPAVVTLSVADTGPGIPVDQRDAIFEAFGQVDAPGRAVREGTGLGLAISRGLVEQMGGALDLESEPGRGSTFTARLPMPRDGAVAARAFPAEVAIPAGCGAAGDLLSERLADCGVAVSREVTRTSRCVVVPGDPAPSDLPAMLGPEARLVVLGDRIEVVESLQARADAVIALPFLAGDLLAALTDGVVTDGAATDAPRAPRLLLADDNATNRLLLDRMLRDTGYDIEIVEDGAAAIEAYGRIRPDAVVLDISMPGIDGIEAAAAIRALEVEREGAVAPILALTAHAGAEMSERLEAAGFLAHLTKPLDKRVLLETLAGAMSRNQANAIR